MNVRFKPEVQRFVEEQVQAGHFASPEELLEEAVQRMIREGEAEMDDETAAAINAAEAALDRGEGADFRRFAAEWRRKIGGK